MNSLFNFKEKSETKETNQGLNSFKDFDLEFLFKLMFSQAADGLVSFNASSLESPSRDELE